MNYKNPLVTIIITTRNCELNIEKTIQSALNQSYKNIEIIIVDDKSTDRTLEICKKFKKNSRLSIIENKFQDLERVHKGVNINAGYYSRNIGIKNSNGEWISFIDGGDLINPSKIELQLREAKKFKCLHVVSNYSTFNSKKDFSDNIYSLDSKIKINNVIKTDELLNILYKQKDFFSIIPLFIRKNIPLKLRQSFKLRKLFYPAPMDPFPGCGPSVFFHRSIKITYRPLRERQWASAKGRGADRDFNFSVLKKYKSSIFIDVDLYYWGT